MSDIFTGRGGRVVNGTLPGGGPNGAPERKPYTYRGDDGRAEAVQAHLARLRARLAAERAAGLADGEGEVRP